MKLNKKEEVLDRLMHRVRCKCGNVIEAGDESQELCFPCLMVNFQKGLDDMRAEQFKEDEKALQFIERTQAELNKMKERYDTTNDI